MAELRANFPTNPTANPNSVVAGDKYRFTVLTDGLLRYEYASDGRFEDRASTFAINRDLGAVPDFQIHEDDSTLEIITDRFHLTYNKTAFSASGLVADIKGKVTITGSQWRFGLDEDELEGLENLGGTARTLDNVDGRCKLEKGLLGRSGFASIDDSKTMLFDERGWVASRRPNAQFEQRIDGYLFAYGLDFKAAIKAFYAVSGNQPQIPRWALGNWWSRYHPYDTEEYLALMDRFSNEKVPLSVAVVDMDWHYVYEEKVTTAGWTGYSWNRRLFPDPKDFCDELHKRELKVALNDHPADGIHAFEDMYEVLGKTLGVDTSRKKPILFNPTDKDFFAAYFNLLHRKLEDDGVDFWWIDWQQGMHSRVPGIDPLWMLNHFQFLDHSHAGKQPMIFSRYGGPGSHRYPVGFSGDTKVTWASLAFQPEFTATASNIGYGWWSHDIGGHMMGGKDDELSTRWVQLGVFSPIMRLHSTLSEWMSKEPWNYHKEFEETMKTFLRLRHRMIPYLHTMNLRSAMDGEPLVQPLYWEYPREKDAYCNKNQYFFGSELMVSPITQPRNSKTRMGIVRAWLPPKSRHVDIFVGLVYDGGRVLNMCRRLDDYPVLAHEGSIIPLDQADVPKNGGRYCNAYEILVVVGKDGKLSIEEDVCGGRSDGPAGRLACKSRRFPIRWKQADGCLQIGPVKSSDTEAGEIGQRDWKVKFICCKHLDLAKVSTHGFEAEVSIDSSMAGGCTVQIREVACDKEVAVTIGPDPQLDVIDIREYTRDIINSYQCEYSVKDQIYECITKDKLSISVRASRLLALGLDEELLNPILELLLADSRQQYLPRFQSSSC